MTDTAPTRLSRPPLSPLFAGAFRDTYPVCADVPNAMMELLQALALREQTPPKLETAATMVEHRGGQNVVFIEDIAYDVRERPERCLGR